jgi:hypothetical protein
VAALPAPAALVEAVPQLVTQTTAEMAVAARADGPGCDTSAVTALPAAQVAVAETAAPQLAGVVPGVAVRDAAELRPEADADMLSVAVPVAEPLMVPSARWLCASTGPSAAADAAAALPLPLTAAASASAGPLGAADAAAALPLQSIAEDSTSAGPSTQCTTRGQH